MWDVRTGMDAAAFGVYVHFPYCLSKCPYCDFASTAAKSVPHVRYADALLRELDARLATLTVRPPVESVFFGGGTPSLWAVPEMKRVLDGLRGALSFSPTVEITLEANPGASDIERFEAFREAGVNRISIGVQSFDVLTLKALGREHGPDAAEAAYRAARAAGFGNVSLDFIYGVHGQTLKRAVEDAERAASLGTDHLSAYALTLEKEALAEEVPLAKQLARGEVTLPPDETVAEMGAAVRDAYRRAGLHRYETSNYCKPNLHSRHNSLYWTGGDYLSIGVGATGTVRDGAGRRRYSNLRSAEKYLAAVESGALPEASEERLSRNEEFGERVAMGLRLTSGVDLRALCGDFQVDYAPRAREAAAMLKNGLCVPPKQDGWLALTDRGMDVHSAVAARLI